MSQDNDNDNDLEGKNNTRKSMIKLIHIEDEMQKSYLDYAMSVIVSRALPDVVDGLKPVHRRILFSMYESGYFSNKPYKKSARIIGNVIGKYHPHSEQAVYDALVRLAQEFSMSLPLIDGQGNFGSLDGDRAAAMRYTEVRLQKVTQYLLVDLHPKIVKFRDNYDNSESEPVVLPARFPNVLVNGASGIAVGMATYIPPHNLAEVIDATIALIDQPDLLEIQFNQIIKGPDFPTGAIICGTSGIQEFHKTGRGRIIVRAKTHEETDKNDRKSIIVTEIPYQVNKSTMIEKIAEMVKDKKIHGIRDIRDESNRKGVRIVLEIKNSVETDIVLNQLYRYTAIQNAINCNMVALDKGMPKLMNSRQVLNAFIASRKITVTKRTKLKLENARDKAHVLIGFATAVTNIDEVISIIKGSKDVATARKKLLSKKWNAAKLDDILKLVEAASNETDHNYYFQLSNEQVKAILEIRLQRLTAMGREEIQNEIKQIAKDIEKYLNIITDPQKILNIMKTELDEIKKLFATPRKTQIIEFEDVKDEEQLIPNDEMVITFSYKGYAKRVLLSTYKAQKRGGKGRKAMTVFKEDFVTKMFFARNHTQLLFFSSAGQVYKKKVYKIPQAQPNAKGRPLVNLLQVENNEVITEVMTCPDKQEIIEKMSIVFATKKGNVRKNKMQDFDRVNKNGKIAMKIENDDEIVATKTCFDDDDVMLFCRSGKCIRFPVRQLRVFSSRNSSGVRGIRMMKGDYVVAMTIIKNIDVNPVQIRAYLKKRRNEGKYEDNLQKQNELTYPNDSNNEDFVLSERKYRQMAQNEQFLFVASERGFGKQTSCYEYRVTRRGGKGIIAMKINDKTGPLCATFPIKDDDEIMLVADSGNLIRCFIKDIRKIGRSTSGVTIFRVESNSKIVSAVRISK